MNFISSQLRHVKILSLFALPWHHFLHRLTELSSNAETWLSSPRDLKTPPIPKKKPLQGLKGDLKSAPPPPPHTHIHTQFASAAIVDKYTRVSQGRKSPICALCPILHSAFAL